jgi:hypothetical protein
MLGFEKMRASWRNQMSEAIENRIRALLKIKTTSQSLSNALFGPLGLFGKLGKTEQERRAISQTPLFKQAHARIMQIERAELEAEHRRIEEACPPADLPDVPGSEVNGVADSNAPRSIKESTSG